MNVVIMAMLLAAAIAAAPAGAGERLGFAHVARPRDGPKQRKAKGVNPLDIASDLDLYVACVRAGLSPALATHVVADTSTIPEWKTVSSLLSLGLAADKAWQPLSERGDLADLASLARSSARSGSAMSEGCERIAERLREESLDMATAKAEKAGVMIAVPLSVCFLPAFFLLGLIPVVLSIGLTVL